MTMTIRVAVAISFALLAGCDVPTCPNGSIDECKAREAMQRKLDKPMRGIEARHDDVRSVTCWVTGDPRGGLSCLPDWMLTKQEQDKCLVKDMGESEACRKLFADQEVLP